MKRKIWVVFVVILVLGATAFLAVRSAEDRVTADMISRAERFAIPADWKLMDELVRSEHFLCMSSNPCPSLSRRWDSGKQLTVDDLTTVVSGVGFAMRTENPCRPPSNAIGIITTCSFSGTDGEYTYMLNVSSPGLNEPQLVTMIVRPHYGAD